MKVKKNLRETELQEWKRAYKEALKGLQAMEKVAENDAHERVKGWDRISPSDYADYNPYAVDNEQATYYVRRALECLKEAYHALIPVKGDNEVYAEYEIPASVYNEPLYEWDR